MENQNYYRIIVDNGFYSNENRLRMWLDCLFGEINFSNKNVLDIGGGVGKYAFYAASEGATNVTIIEPEGAGSKSGTINSFEILKAKFPDVNNITFIPKTFQEFESKNKYDIIYLTSSINHLDEEACTDLLKNKEFRARYDKIFEKISSLANPGADLIFSDCGRSNFFGDIGLKNFIAPNLEWKKHQDPGVWINLLKPFGFKPIVKKWRAPNRFGKFGQIFFANSFIAYFTSSNFYVRMKKVSD